MAGAGCTPAPRWLVSGTSSASPGPGPIPLQRGGVHLTAIHTSLTSLTSPSVTNSHFQSQRVLPPSVASPPAHCCVCPQVNCPHLSRGFCTPRIRGNTCFCCDLYNCGKYVLSAQAGGKNALTPGGTRRGGGGKTEHKAQGRIREMEGVGLSTDFSY